jgi:hypothetical protein
MFTNSDLGDAIQCRIIANPAMVADDNLPGKGHPNSWAHQNVSADLGAE